jgi:hypothetical protein
LLPSLFQKYQNILDLMQAFKIIKIYLAMYQGVFGGISLLGAMGFSHFPKHMVKLAIAFLYFDVP